MRKPLILPALAMALLLGACGSEDAESSNKTEGTGKSDTAISGNGFAGKIRFVYFFL